MLIPCYAQDFENDLLNEAKKYMPKMKTNNGMAQFDTMGNLFENKQKLADSDTISRALSRLYSTKIKDRNGPIVMGKDNFLRGEKDILTSKQAVEKIANYANEIIPKITKRRHGIALTNENGIEGSYFLINDNLKTDGNLWSSKKITDFMSNFDPDNYIKPQKLDINQKQNKCKVDSNLIPNLKISCGYSILNSLDLYKNIIPNVILPPENQGILTFTNNGQLKGNGEIPNKCLTKHIIVPEIPKLDESQFIESETLEPNNLATFNNNGKLESVDVPTSTHISEMAKRTFSIIDNTKTGIPCMNGSIIPLSTFVTADKLSGSCATVNFSTISDGYAVFDKVFGNINQIDNKTLKLESGKYSIKCIINTKEGLVTDTVIEKGPMNFQLKISEDNILPSNFIITKI
jgi:hypothetical protein